MRRSFLKLTGAPLAFLLASCADSTDATRLATPRPGQCGFSIAKDYRLTDQIRNNPPACALPKADEVALWCAIHDRMSEPGYFSLPTDEEGSPIDTRPLPAYKVTGLICEFTSELRNTAMCTFKIAEAGQKATGSAITTKWDHIYWRNDGPAHHLEGVRWSLSDDCMPDKLMKK